LDPIDAQTLIAKVTEDGEVTPEEEYDLRESRDLFEAYGCQVVDNFLMSLPSFRAQRSGDFVAPHAADGGMVYDNGQLREGNMPATQLSDTYAWARRMGLY